MKKLYEILGQKPNKGDVGIEIEVEGRNLTDAVDARWVATVDGSLRGENREYVLKKPLPVGAVKEALEVLEQNLKDAGSKLDFSFRTSVHVHINCQDLTFNQYLNMLYAYFLLEEPFMTYCGKERKGNRFCLRLQDAEGMLETYNMLFRVGERGIREIPHDHVRYSAMNIEATPKYGSLEFRGMRGNLDVDNINTWVDALVRLREFAKSVDNPTEVYNLYAQREPQGFMEKVLGDLAGRFYYPRLVKDVQRSFSLSLDLPFSYAESAKRIKEEKEVREKYRAAAELEANLIADIAEVHPWRAVFEEGVRAVPPPAPRRRVQLQDVIEAQPVRRGEF